MKAAASETRDWIEQIAGPAALLWPSPWRLTPNRAWQALLGTAPWPGLGEDAAAKAEPLAQGLAQGRPFGLRLRVPAHQGTESPRLLQADFAPLPGAPCWVCTVVELSAFERPLQRRALTLERLLHTLDQLQEVISYVSHDEVLLFMNAAYAHFFGTTRDQAIGRTLKEVMGPNHKFTAPPRHELFRTLQPQRVERVLIDPNGEVRVLSITLCPVLSETGGPPKMTAIGRDVTLRHRGMQTLRQTLDRLDALFEAGIEGIVLCENGLVSDANPIACRLLGLQREQLVGQPMLGALQRLGVPPPQQLPEAEDGCPSLQLSLRPGEHGAPPLQVRSIALRAGASLGHAVLLQDMSYRHEAQQRIKRLLDDLRWQTSRAEAADRSKSVFLASASHDLRQPIHALGLFLTTIQSLSRTSGPPQVDALTPIVQRMRASLNSLMQLLDMLLGASLRDSGQPPPALRPMALQPVLHELWSQFGPAAAERGLVLHVLPSRAWVLGEPTVLRRILANLLSNAVRYTERGRIVLGARWRGQEIELQVWDTGVGIAPGQRESIFQEFYRVDVGHSAHAARSEGLGLAIVRRAAAELGAQLDLRSTPGHGSMFSVRLPRCDAQGRAEPHGESAARPAEAGSLHVLLIDDDEQVLLATSSLLESWGHRVSCAASASEALRLCASGSLRVDALICDYMLDPSMNGLELLLLLRSQHTGPLPVCMVTGDMSAERVEQARRHGFTLLHKPVDARTLRRFLQGAP